MSFVTLLIAEHTNIEIISNIFKLLRDNTQIQLYILITVIWYYYVTLKKLFLYVITNRK